jgi:hypothetical protein
LIPTAKMPDFIIALIVGYYPVKNPLWQKGTDLSKYIFSLVHGSKQAKNALGVFKSSPP